MEAEHLLLLPGMMCDERLWAMQSEGLKDECAAITVADLSSADNVYDAADRVLATAPETFALAGLSMGGVVAFEMWRQAPQRITRLALLGTNAEADSPTRRELRDELLARVVQGELKQVMIDSLKPCYLAASNYDNQALLDTIIAMALDLGEDVFIRQTRALRNRPDSVEMLSSISVPTLVLCGREDSLCPVDSHRLMAERIPKARLVIVEECGHLATMEQPQRVTAEMQAWLKAA